MDKQNIIALLRSYHPFDDIEADMKGQMINFINSNDRFFDHRIKNGHVTGSAWILNREHSYALLTKHILLNKWYQLGGHVEDDLKIKDVAFREAFEECGLQSLKLLSEQIFSIDIHTIPATPKMEAHDHYDIRFLFDADMTETLIMSHESKELKWIPLNEIQLYNNDQAIARMVIKSSKPNIA